MSFRSTSTSKLRKQPPRLAVADTRAIKREAKVALPFYLSPEWRALMKSLIAKRGRRCERPECRRSHGADGRPVRIFGDHIIELRDNGAPLDPANVMLLCASCHANKTVAARVVRAGSVPDEPVA